MGYFGLRLVLDFRATYPACPLDLGAPLQLDNSPGAMGGLPTLYFANGNDYANTALEAYRFCYRMASV